MSGLLPNRRHAITPDGRTSLENHFTEKLRIVLNLGVYDAPDKISDKRENRAFKSPTFINILASSAPTAQMRPDCYRIDLMLGINLWAAANYNNSSTRGEALVLLLWD